MQNQSDFLAHASALVLVDLLDYSFFPTSPND